MSVSLQNEGTQRSPDFHAGMVDMGTGFAAHHGLHTSPSGCLREVTQHSAGEEDKKSRGHATARLPGVLPECFCSTCYLEWSTSAMSPNCLLILASHP